MKKSSFWILISAWIFPGAGHYLVGQRWKGIVFFSIFSLAYLSGMALGDFRNVSPQREPFYFAIQFFSGAFVVIASLATAHLSTSPIWNTHGYHAGCLYTSVVSLLNLLVLIHLHSILELSDGALEKTRS